MTTTASAIVEPIHPLRCLQDRAFWYVIPTEFGVLQRENQNCVLYSVQISCVQKCRVHVSLSFNRQCDSTAVICSVVAVGSAVKVVASVFNMPLSQLIVTISR